MKVVPRAIFLRSSLIDFIRQGRALFDFPKRSVTEQRISLQRCLQKSGYEMIMIDLTKFLYERKEI
jgi:hypothetical protein